MDKYRILVKGIVRYEDKYLVVRKWYDDRVATPYQWEFIDGTIDFAEDPEKSVLRHIFEQTGITAVIDRVLYTWSFLTGDVFNIGVTFLCIAPYDSIVISEDLVDYRFIGREEFPEYLKKNVLEDIERMELPL